MKEAIEENTIFDSVDDAVKQLKLDKRHKWFEFMGEVVYHHSYTHICSGCDGGGCQECGYHGKSRTGCPIPALHPNTGNPVKVFIANNC
jgi:hypothetical protein